MGIGGRNAPRPAPAPPPLLPPFPPPPLPNAGEGARKGSTRTGSAAEVDNRLVLVVTLWMGGSSEGNDGCGGENAEPADGSTLPLRREPLPPSSSSPASNWQQ